MEQLTLQLGELQVQCQLIEKNQNFSLLTQTYQTQQRSRSSNATLIHHYNKELKVAQQMGDLEGERHVHRLLAFRLNIFGDLVNAQKHEDAAKTIESVAGPVKNDVRSI